MEFSLPPGTGAALRGLGIAFAALLALTIVLALRRRGGPSDGKRSSLIPRARAWIVAAALLFLAVCLGPVAVMLLTVLIAWLAAGEVLALFDRRQGRGDRDTIVFRVSCAFPPMGAALSGAVSLTLGTFLAGAVLALLQLRTVPSPSAIGMLAGRIAALIWIGVPLGMLVALRAEPDGFAILYWLLLVTALTDICAMLGGLMLGRTPFVPSISPSKTIEGVLAGFVGAAFAATLARPVFAEPPLLLFAAATLAVAIAGMVGDIVASWIKRCANASDFGTLLPGHGGILDRIDSLLFAAPVAFALTQLSVV